MDAFVVLLIAHLIADFPLQTGWVYKMKIKSLRGLILHVAMHPVITALLIKDVGQWWGILLGLFGLHFLIDWVKLRIKTKIQVAGFLLDQLAHVVSLIFLASLADGLQSYLPRQFLVPILLGVLVPAFFTFLWVLAMDFKPKQASVPGVIVWVRKNMLFMTQVWGLAAIVIIVFVVR